MVPISHMFANADDAAAIFRLRAINLPQQRICRRTAGTAFRCKKFNEDSATIVLVGFAVCLRPHLQMKYDSGNGREGTQGEYRFDAMCHSGPLLWLYIRHAL
jgi:hypothetical protein